MSLRKPRPTLSKNSSGGVPRSVLSRSQTAEGGRCRVVEYVTGPGKALKELIIQPYESVMAIAAVSRNDGDENLFQLPRTDNFLRAFAKMSYAADQALHDLLDEMGRVARKRGEAADA